MISVQNRRLPLNGNSLTAVFLLLTLLLALSCTGSKKTSGYVPGQGHTGENTGPVVRKDSLPGLSESKKKADTLDLIYPDEKKKTYQIAYLLPFNLDEAETGDEAHPGGITRAVLEFYMGATTALYNKELMPEKNGFQVRFYDTKGSETQVKSIIAKDFEKNKPDLIIGPFMPGEIKYVSEYSLKKKIPFVTPVSNSPECLMRNPYMIAEKPSVKSHLEFFAHYVKEHQIEGNIIMIGASKKENDTALFILKKFIDSNLVKRVKTIVVNESNWTSRTYLNYLGDKKALFYIPLTNEFVVNSVIGSLITSQKTENLTIIAPYRWLELNSVDISYLLSMDVIYLADQYFDYSNPENKNFISAYRAKYQTEPSRFSYLGYTITLQYAELLSQKGKYFIKSVFINRNSPAGKFGAYENYGIYKGFEKNRLFPLKFIDFELREMGRE